MKPFAKWTIEEVEEKFLLTLEKPSDPLHQWMMYDSALSIQEEQQLLALREKLETYVWDWNEDELKVYFIGPLLIMVNFDQKHYHSFLSRDLSVQIDGEELAGTVDFVVASGRRSPKRPYFLFTNTKKNTTRLTIH